MAPQVKANIVIMPAAGPSDIPYAFGSMDFVATNQNISCSNYDDSNVISWNWTLYPNFNQAFADFQPQGAVGNMFSFFPPSGTDKIGDIVVQLDVTGAPLDNGFPNVATAKVVVGIRTQVFGFYSLGLPVVHSLETSLGGGFDGLQIVADVTQGFEERVAEFCLGIYNGVTALDSGTNVLPIAANTVSNNTGTSGAPFTVSEFYFDPAELIPAGASIVGATLVAVTKASNASNAAVIELRDPSALIASSQISTASTSPVENDVDVGTYFATASAGIYKLQSWTNPHNGTDTCTVYAAYLLLKWQIG